MSVDFVHLKYPRLTRAVESYVGDRVLARRYVAKAARGEELYQRVVNEALQALKRRRKQCTRG